MDMDREALYCVETSFIMLKLDMGGRYSSEKAGLLRISSFIKMDKTSQIYSTFLIKVVCQKWFK